jgi:hypothetical protein
MSKFNRRKAIGMGLVAGGAVALPSLAVAAADDVPRATADQPLLMPGETQESVQMLHDSFDRKVARETAEIIRYHKQFTKACVGEKLRPACFWPAIAVPMLTLPKIGGDDNGSPVYARNLGARADMPDEPQIPYIHEMLLSGVGAYGFIALIGNSLVDQLSLIPEGVQLQERLDVHYPNGKLAEPYRVVSPTYTIDVEEPLFSMRVTASMIMEAVLGICAAHERKREGCQDMVAAAKAKAGRGGTGTDHYQVTPIRFDLERKAFMLSVMAWSNGAGCSAYH